MKWSFAAVRDDEEELITVLQRISIMPAYFYVIKDFPVLCYLQIRKDILFHTFWKGIVRNTPRISEVFFGLKIVRAEGFKT